MKNRPWTGHARSLLRSVGIASPLPFDLAYRPEPDVALAHPEIGARRLARMVWHHVPTSAGADSYFVGPPAGFTERLRWDRQRSERCFMGRRTTGLTGACRVRLLASFLVR
jgi:hypothetical protein